MAKEMFMAWMKTVGVQHEQEGKRERKWRSEKRMTIVCEVEARDIMQSVWFQ